MVVFLASTLSTFALFLSFSLTGIPNIASSLIAMPNILSIPREIRDEIYGWGLRDTLTSSYKSLVDGAREQVELERANPEAYFGEKVICYPKHTPLPPTHSLLQTSRQLRAELSEYIKRAGPLTYRIDVKNRTDKSGLYPSWIYVPILAKRIDCIEVQVRTRRTKTSSVFTIGSDMWASESEMFDASFALLERFLERGVYLLSKKKREMMTIGLLLINVVEKSDGFSENEFEFEVGEWGDRLDEWMRGVDNLNRREPEEIERKDKQFQLLSTRIGKVRLTVDEKLKREWDFKEMIQKREERRQTQEGGAQQ